MLKILKRNIRHVEMREKISMHFNGGQENMNANISSQQTFGNQSEKMHHAPIQYSLTQLY